MAEYASSGIWIKKQLGGFRHVGVSYSYLKLPPSLVAGFTGWIDYYNKYARYDNFDADALNEEGLRLAIELKGYLGEGSSVEFQGETQFGELLEPVIIH